MGQVLHNLTAVVTSDARRPVDASINAESVALHMWRARHRGGFASPCGIMTVCCETVIFRLLHFCPDTYLDLPMHMAGQLNGGR